MISSMDDLERGLRLFQRADEILSVDCEKLFNELGKAEKRTVAEVNIMDVFGVSRRELSHSKFIAWLLDPLETHGLGTRFLCSLMRKAGVPENISPKGVRVRTEVRRKNSIADIVIENDSFCCIVENKTRSGEGRHQTMRLYDDFGAEADCRPFFPVYLSPGRGDKPECEEFRVLTYYDIHEMIREIEAGEEVKLVLDIYLKNLEANIMKEFRGFSEESRLYAENYELVKRLKNKFRSEVRRLFSALEEELRGREWYCEDWKFHSNKVSWFQIYKDNWENQKKDGIHFEVRLKPEMVKDNVLQVALHAESAISDKRAEFNRLLREHGKKTLSSLRGFRTKTGRRILEKLIRLDDEDLVKNVAEEIDELVKLSPAIDKAVRSL